MTPVFGESVFLTDQLSRAMPSKPEKKRKQALPRGSALSGTGSLGPRIGAMLASLRSSLALIIMPLLCSDLPSALGRLVTPPSSPGRPPLWLRPQVHRHNFCLDPAITPVRSCNPTSRGYKVPRQLQHPRGYLLPKGMPQAHVLCMTLNQRERGACAD